MAAEVADSSESESVMFCAGSVARAGSAPVTVGFPTLLGKTPIMASMTAASLSSRLLMFDVGWQHASMVVLPPPTVTVAVVGAT